MYYQLYYTPSHTDKRNVNCDKPFGLTQNFNIHFCVQIIVCPPPTKFLISSRVQYNCTLYSCILYIAKDCHAFLSFEWSFVFSVAGKLQGFEIPMRVTICPDFWTPDMGLVTAAFKLRRTQIHSHYATDITRMYAWGLAQTTHDAHTPAATFPHLADSPVCTQIYSIVMYHAAHTC